MQRATFLICPPAALPTVPAQASPGGALPTPALDEAALVQMTWLAEAAGSALRPPAQLGL